MGVGLLVWKRSCWLLEWYECAFGLPGRHPVFGRCDSLPSLGGALFGPDGRGAWWFENWIVDASRKIDFFLLYI